MKRTVKVFCCLTLSIAEASHGDQQLRGVNHHQHKDETSPKNEETTRKNCCPEHLGRFLMPGDKRKHSQMSDGKNVCQLSKEEIANLVP